jgi:hypothetical protein
VDRFGVQLWYLVATVSVLLMAAIMALNPAMMGLEDRHRAQAIPVPATPEAGLVPAADGEV